MLPKIELLQDRIPLYNNIAWYQDHQGRLSSHLDVFPSPQINWDFEVIGDQVTQKGILRSEYPMSSLNGYQFQIAHPIPTRDTHNFIVPLEGLSGKAQKTIFGDSSYLGHSFKLYLPNTHFQAINQFGQEIISTTDKLHEEVVGSGIKGKLIKAQLDATWHINLYTSSEALKWLDTNKSNIGTKITAIGALHSNMNPEVKFVDYPTMSLEEANQYSEILSILLSFINGGYISPVFIEGHYYGSSKPISEPSATALAPSITPLELIGRSWCTYDSDLPAYFSCFQVLKKMLAEPPWNETFPLILAWYFQAIQPENMYSGKMWQIVANALGTALERIGYTILVLEEEDQVQRNKNEVLFSNDFKNIKKVWGKLNTSSSVKKLQLLLERIGLTVEKGYWDLNEVKNFIDIRNEATHPRKGRVDQNRIFDLLDIATQWVYEIVLWRLGYTGRYLIRRAPGMQSTPQRYDLSTRNKDW